MFRSPWKIAWFSSKFFIFLIDIAGVYEDARLAYLPDVLFRRKGTPAALAILLSDILRRLMIKGSIDFVARIDCSDFSSVPRAEIIPGLKRSSILTNVSDQRHIQSSETAAPENAEAIASLNLLSSDTLVECLSHLKRSYWPFSWSGRRGGFIGAAKNFLDGADSAEIEAIARAAAHRIRRGIDFKTFAFIKILVVTLISLIFNYN